MKRAANTNLGRKDFKCVDSMVKIGDFIEGEEVLQINKLQLTGSQPRLDNNEWDFYQVITTFNKGTEDTNELFICYYG